MRICVWRSSRLVLDTEDYLSVRMSGKCCVLVSDTSSCTVRTIDVKRRQMAKIKQRWSCLKKGILGFIAAACVMISGCGSVGSHSVLPSSSPVEERQKLTILHIDAEKKGFQEFIRQAEEKLNMEINCGKMARTNARQQAGKNIDKYWHPEINCRSDIS